MGKSACPHAFDDAMLLPTRRNHVHTRSVHSLPTWVRAKIVRNVPVRRTRRPHPPFAPPPRSPLTAPPIARHRLPHHAGGHTHTPARAAAARATHALRAVRARRHSRAVHARRLRPPTRPPPRAPLVPACVPLTSRCSRPCPRRTMPPTMPAAAAAASSGRCAECRSCPCCLSCHTRDRSTMRPGHERLRDRLRGGRRFDSRGSARSDILVRPRPSAFFAELGDRFERAWPISARRSALFVHESRFREATRWGWLCMCIPLNLML